MLAPYGAAAVRRPQSTGRASDLLGFLDDWATDDSGPSATFLYWVGHGSREGPHAWLLAGGSRSPLSDARAVNATAVADMLRTRWIERTAGDGGWTVLVLDCCRGRDAATAIVNALTADPGSRPGQLAIVEVGGTSASEVGRFADALGEALKAFEENDASIPLRSLLFAATDRLGVQVEPTIWLSREAVIGNPRAGRSVLTVSRDVIAEWREAVAGLSVPMRDHFLEKAKSAELGVLGWNFVGRHDESRRLVEWVRQSSSGMLVLTGEPGAGKSALLGRLVTLSDPGLAALLERSRLVVDDRAPRPEPGSVDGVVLLTGQTVHDTIAAVEAAVPAVRFGDMAGIVSVDGPVTVVFDGLDEAQSPYDIAYDVIRPLSDHPNVRVIVGTRRSLEEGPDLARPIRHELLDALGVAESDAVVLRREPRAMARYARRRLMEATPALPEEVIDRIERQVEAVDQPFLFIRLAIGEILARADRLDETLMEAVLSANHGDLFLMAMQRLSTDKPRASRLLRSLGYAQGRGLPRHDGVWAATAAGLHPGEVFTEADISDALIDAAAYVVMDGEHDQTVYRLAHKTFTERFLAEDGELSASHAAITDSLLALVGSGRWHNANPYLLAHTSRHAASSKERLDRLITDVGWLDAVLRRFGVDTLLSILDTAAINGAGDALERVRGAVRRARVALNRDVDQLAAQLVARLRDEPATQPLLDGLAEIAPPLWLRTRIGGGDWTATNDTTIPFDAKVRALTPSRRRGRPVVIVGTGDTAYAWDPSSGGLETLLRTEGQRVLDLAAVSIDGRELLAVASHDAPVSVYSVHSGTATLRTDLHARPIAVGYLDRRPTLAAASGLELQLVPLDGSRSRAVSFDYEILAVAAVDDTMAVLLRDERRLIVHRLDGRADVAITVPDDVRAHALVPLDMGLLLVVGRSVSVEAWHVDSGRFLGAAHVDPGFIIRTVSALVVNGELGFTAGNRAITDNGQVVFRTPGAQPTPRATPSQLGTALAVSLGSNAALIVDSPEPELIDPTGVQLRTASVDGADLAAIFGAAAPDRDPISGGLRLGPSGPRTLPRQDSVLHPDRPREWPIDVRAFGRRHGEPVVATAGLEGTCWLWSTVTGSPVAGPFGDWGPVTLYTPYGMDTKNGPEPARAVAYLESPHHAMLACVSRGRVSCWDISTGEPITVPDSSGSEATAVALALHDDTIILVTGAAGGAISLWSIPDGTRLAGLTLDSAISRLWYDHVERTIAVLTADGRLHELEVTTN